ncbi:hypothetical protein NDU88_005755 [Pleurodeles waltl]|uniref:Uncharacterized protein n=1 Tax=Pleurodeles waltl TaxID=8319 RepID=A0AAV7UN05_PLEWA|nr:hypothetical protein NDU88_005755 [Pleurodeles waltl]
MGAGRRPLLAVESGAANWFYAALELRRSRQAATRIPLGGSTGRGSTSCLETTRAGKGEGRRYGLPIPQKSSKGKILTKALELGSLDSGDTKFEIRSDLSRTTLNRQWELGKRLEELKKLRSEVRLRFPANLRVMLNNKMYNIRDPVAADDLLNAIKKGNMV